MLDNKLEEQKENLIKEITGIHWALGFSACISLEFAKNIKDVVELFIYYLKLSYICFIRFDFNEYWKFFSIEQKDLYCKLKTKKYKKLSLKKRKLKKLFTMKMPLR